MSDDRTGGLVGNGDMIMALLSKDPYKTWKQGALRDALKLSDNEFKTSVADLSKWVKVDPTNMFILLSDRTDIGIGNGYWAGDHNRFDAALKAAADRSGGVIGNG